MEMRLDTESIQKKSSFNYLESIIQENYETDEDVTHCVGAGWMEWGLAFRVMRDKKMLSKFKGKLYRVIVRPTILYGVECWSELSHSKAKSSGHDDVTTDA